MEDSEQGLKKKRVRSRVRKFSGGKKNAGTTSSFASVIFSPCLCSDPIPSKEVHERARSSSTVIGREWKKQDLHHCSRVQRMWCDTNSVVEHVL